MKQDDDIIGQIDRTPAPDPAASHRLYTLAGGLLVALCALFVYRAGGDIGAGTLVGLAVLVLAFVPALQWTRLNRTWFPAFEIFSLSAAAFYALPLLLEHKELSVYPPSVVIQSGLLVVAFLVSANAGFSALRNPVKTPAWAASSLLPDFAYRYLPVGVALNTVYVYIECFTTLIPFDVQGTLRAFFFGIGTLCTFVLAKLWGMRVLPRRTVVLFTINIAVQLILQFSQLYLITGISLLAITVISFSSARRQLPWLLIAVTIPVLALLHNGKSSMRSIYWAEGAARISLVDLPGYFTEWVGYGFNPADEDLDKKRTSIFERASLIQMLCLSVDRIPDVRPYLEGESYVDLPAQVIPRFLWPNKPSSLLANVRLAVHFGLVDPDNAMQVSIAFGMIAEAFCNFGWIGVVLLGFLMGMGFRRIAMLSLGAAQFSALGILMILLTAWSFQAEFILATWLTSLFQAAVVCIGVPLVYRQFTTR